MSTKGSGRACSPRLSASTVHTLASTSFRSTDVLACAPSLNGCSLRLFGLYRVMRLG